MDYKNHYSVMKQNILQILSENFKDEESLSLLDLTFGAGGHSFSFLEKFINAKVVGFDQDPEALKNGYERIKRSDHRDRIQLIDSNFCFLEKYYKKGLQFDGILLDAGVSSHQFDSGERGFSFRFDGPLDMRMNPKDEVSAADLCNSLSMTELYEIIKEYGEEKFAKNIAKGIVKKRDESPLKRTSELEDICFHAYPKNMRHGKIHPATKTFQAFRIKVNNELGVLTDVIGQSIERLKEGGLFMVISFHSLEDRIVKHAFKNWKKEDYPIEILTKKPILPSSLEINENSRSRSAKLRVVRRLKEWPSKNKYFSQKGV